MFAMLFIPGLIWVAAASMRPKRTPAVAAGAPPVAADEPSTVLAAIRRWRLVGWWMLSAGMGGGLGGYMAATLPWPALWAIGFALASGYLCLLVIGGNAETPVGTAKRQQALGNGLALAVVVVLTWWLADVAEKRQDPAWVSTPWSQVLYVRGVVRDGAYIKERLDEGQFGGVNAQDLPKPAAGSVWSRESLNRPGNLDLIALVKEKSSVQTKITVAGLNDLRAGYTIQVVAEKPDGDPVGWLHKSTFTAGAWIVLKGVVERQRLADGRRWPGRWNDAATGELIPYRFYERQVDKAWVRVANPRVAVGPEGERIMDLSLYHSHEKIVATVKAKATALGRPYRGGRAPVKGANLF